ncbi:hypothetical protein TBLA_0D04070 [Henningerozyma blattae CBS 6284]|uniref:Cyclin n=1 Tax=Henningerozyma blattae (strain ATCC 34711 / CBS 6284 / DSM 70876 / NBRC 10599 / NRRL Y-10934 / UCD 77-7) TaxID=1071380 RepID=I2H3F2_HENB6|nr:hypothetical protein TBLA_0D04070 [Tetrapisispora blattae CBS 6284]CCH60904.1 hypothetical protein TBLA_0D04070 [Tetrapisispora blattae CBS 6284]
MATTNSIDLSLWAHHNKKKKHSSDNQSRNTSTNNSDCLIPNILHNTNQLVDDTNNNNVDCDNHNSSTNQDSMELRNLTPRMPSAASVSDTTTISTDTTSSEPISTESYNHQKPKPQRTSSVTFQYEDEDATQMDSDDTDDAGYTDRSNVHLTLITTGSRESSQAENSPLNGARNTDNKGAKNSIIAGTNNDEGENEDEDEDEDEIEDEDEDDNKDSTLSTITTTTGTNMNYVSRIITRDLVVDEDDTDNSVDRMTSVSSDDSSASVLITSNYTEAPGDQNLLIRSNQTPPEDLQTPTESTITTTKKGIAFIHPKSKCNSNLQYETLSSSANTNPHTVTDNALETNSSRNTTVTPQTNLHTDLTPHHSPTRLDSYSVPPSSLNIAEFPTTKLLEMLTALLNKIIKSNDCLAGIQPDALTNVNTPPQNLTTNNGEVPNYLSSILSFRGKHIPQITLFQYFQRIQKYCPISNDVFLSLLVYFDRISKRCNTISSNDVETTNNENNDKFNDFTHSPNNNNNNNNNNNTVNYHRNPNNDNKSSNSPQDEHLHENFKNINSQNNSPAARIPSDSNALSPNSQVFVMDSYNIHRLIIAGVTVATKFFSDYFYSNARYAKVGGITLQELNHLELQFLLLCDFKLLISVNELQRYADLLYRFWKNTSNST